jgi:replication factor C small subunit
MEFNPLDRVFTEKYRPKTFDTLVMDADKKELIKRYIQNPKAVPHMLFYSRTPGTGKTSLAKVIIRALGCDYLSVNSSDDRGIDAVREKIKQFCITRSTKEEMKRCIFLDEADGMTPQSQEALRNMMETYESNVFFILTANNINKVKEALQSRCEKITFAYPDKKAVADYLEHICQKENMDYSIDGLMKLIDLNYPSIRDCVLVLQDLYVAGKPVVPDNVRPLNPAYEDIWILIKKKEYSVIKKTIMEGLLEPRDLNMYLWEKALDEDNFKMIQITCKNEKDIADGANPTVIVMSSIPEMIK